MMRDSGINRIDLGVLYRTASACRRYYREYPNVLDVGVGLRQRDGKVDDTTPCVQFYVSRKREVPRYAQLPRFVCARHPDGAVDRTRRIPTDVLEIGRAEALCRAGEAVEALGECGGLTLLFRNHDAAMPGMFVLTCAHVAGDVRHSPPIDDSLSIPRANGEPLKARTVVNAVQHAGTLDYDVALARLEEAVRGHPTACRVAGSAQVLDGLLSESGIYPGADLETAFPVSGGVSTQVLSSRVQLDLFLDETIYTVPNLFLADCRPQPGDSGGLLYSRSLAAGILVGRCGAGGLFQPLGEAVSYVRHELGWPIRCFQ